MMCQHRGIEFQSSVSTRMAGLGALATRTASQQRTFSTLIVHVSRSICVILLFGKHVWHIDTLAYHSCADIAGKTPSASRHILRDPALGLIVVESFARLSVTCQGEAEISEVKHAV
jgi:hypothetical protein